MKARRSAPEPPEIPGSRWIPLGDGRFTLVDEADYQVVGALPWNYQFSKEGGYAGFTKNRKTTLLHRVILGASSQEFVDHRNRDGLDNRRDNLRVATKAQNNRNSRARNQSGVKGASYDKSRQLWRSTITFGGKQIWLGYFSDAESAGRAYDRAAREYFGEFARLNHPDERDR